MYQNKIPIYPIFYLLEGDYRPSGSLDVVDPNVPLIIHGDYEVVLLAATCFDEPRSPRAISMRTLGEHRFVIPPQTLESVVHASEESPFQDSYCQREWPKPWSAIT